MPGILNGFANKSNKILFFPLLFRTFWAVASIIFLPYRAKRNHVCVYMWKIYVKAPEVCLLFRLLLLKTAPLTLCLCLCASVCVLVSVCSEEGPLKTVSGHVLEGSITAPHRILLVHTHTHTYDTCMRRTRAHKHTNTDTRDCTGQDDSLR